MFLISFCAVEENSRKIVRLKATTSDEEPPTVAYLTQKLASHNDWQVISVREIPRGHAFSAESDWSDFIVLVDSNTPIEPSNLVEEASYLLVCRDNSLGEGLETVQEETGFNVKDGLLLLNGRPECNRRPLTTLHAIFSLFLDRCGNSSPNPTMLLESHNFIAATAAYYSDETQRERAIRPSMEILVPDLQWQQSFDGCKPDGSLFVLCGLFPRNNYDERPLVLVFDHKPGFGVGTADPIDQATLAYGRAAGRTCLDRLKGRSCLPAFIVAMAAPILTIYGAAYTDKSICQPLVTLNLLTPLSNGVHPSHLTPRERLVHQVAGVFDALKACIGDLRAEYADMSSTSPLPNEIIFHDPSEKKASPTPHAPHVRRLTIQGFEYILQYEAQLCPERMSTAVYIATAYPVTSDEPLHVERERCIKCVVKFTDQYSPKAHSVMYANEAAPELLHCAYNDTVRMFVVVTRYIKQSGKLSHGGKNALLNAVAKLHEAGLVHGDLREPNILVRGGKAFVIDFDWAGHTNIVLYPHDINTQLVWADGVRPGVAIL
ncbi:hypothetical protein EXIGLDRAFT_831962, partial [Exidia glandulosa HHB12029]